MPRSLTSFSLAVTALLTAASVGSVHAKECKSDVDCASGFECVLGKIGTSTGGSTGSASGGSAGVGAATGTCDGPDCPVTQPGPNTQPDPDTTPVPADAGMTVTPVGTTPPRVVDGGVAVVFPSRPDAGLTTPIVTTGFCQVKLLTCTSKADCPANLDCVKETAAVKRPACAEGTVCDTTPLPESGVCKAVCVVDADCPSPLVCKELGRACTGGAVRNPDGTVTTLPTTCTPGNKICSYEPVTCTSDTDCTVANFQCAKVSEGQACTGQGPTCVRSKDDPEAVCTPTPVEPPVCTTLVVNNCMPKEIKCDAGQACPAGWSCFDFTNFESAAVPGWSTPMPSNACLPDGLILTIKGQANGGSGSNYGSSSTPTRGGQGTVDIGLGGSPEKGGSSGGENGPVTTGGGTVPPQTGPVPASDGHESAPLGDAGVEATTTKIRGGGCAMGGAQDGSFGLWLTLGLAGLVLRLVRRRR